MNNEELLDLYVLTVETWLETRLLVKNQDDKRIMILKKHAGNYQSEIIQRMYGNKVKI